MIRDLRDILLDPPNNMSIEMVWNAYQRVRPKFDKSITPQRTLTDIISLIRFELNIYDFLEPRMDTLDRLFKDWVFRKNAGPVQFTDEQMKWLRMIKDHIVSSVRIEKDDFDFAPFVDEGGLGKMWKLFGEETEDIIEEINEELAA